MEDNKSIAEQLKEKLVYEPENVYLNIDEEYSQKAYDFAVEYKNFLDQAKTEREACDYILEKAKKLGYTEFDINKKYKAGDKLYVNNRNKAVILSTIGSEDIEKGVSIVASHIDSPRLDLKGRPLYEESQLAMFKTHYYGGIKKYQWTAIPLALHGVIIDKEGNSIKVNIGEDESDPVFCVTDLLPHLGAEQMKKTLANGITGEQLNILVGSRPFKDDKVSEKVKLNILDLLNKKYGIIEKDFLTAELSIVPAFKAKDVGIDRSFVGAYGHDDRVCAYASLISEFETKQPLYTTVSVFADKEEIGSVGATGLEGAFLKYYILNLSKTFEREGRVTISNSKCLSADVNAAFDPNYPDVYERKNSCYVNYGVVLTKYTGSRGKAGASDCSAEFMNYVTRLADKEKINWQIGELGKVDAGGGGTVAGYIANLDIDVLDVGVPVLSMHSPFEVISKLDLYETYRTFVVFLSR